jgi:hypothetical protein
MSRKGSKKAKAAKAAKATAGRNVEVMWLTGRPLGMSAFGGKADMVL